MFEIFGNFFEYVWKFFRVLEKFSNRFRIFSEHSEIIPNGFGHFSKLLEKFEIDLEMFMC